jgi:type IV fimbrial biogenesis protein FimT
MKPTTPVPVFLARAGLRRVPSRLRGLTLIELMVTLAIAGLVVAVGAPSFLRVLARHAIAAQAEELQDALRVGRNEAMKRNGPVVLCRTESSNTSHCAGSGGNWQTWLLFADLGRTGAFAGGDPILRQHLEVSSRMSVASNAASLRFESTGIVHSDTGATPFTLGPAGTAADGSGSDVALQRQVCVNPRGEVVVIAGGVACP